MAAKKKALSAVSDPEVSEFVPDTKKARPCKVARSIEALSEEDKRKVEKAQSYLDISHRAISQFFQSRKQPVADSTVAAHRSKACTCYL